MNTESKKSEFYIGDEPDEDELMKEECGQLSDGSCTLAGTEYCEMLCPYHGQ